MPTTFLLSLGIFFSTIFPTYAQLGYELRGHSELNFEVKNLAPRSVVTSWRYTDLDEINGLDFPQYGNDLISIVPGKKKSKAKVVAFKLAARIPISVSEITRKLITDKSFLHEVNGLEFVQGKERTTLLGKYYEGYMNLPFNKALMSIDLNFLDLEQDLGVIGYQAFIDQFTQGDEDLGLPKHLIVSKMRDINNGYLHGMYAVFKVYHYGVNEALLVSYMFSIVDGGHLLIRFAGGSTIKSSLDESSVSFIEGLASFAKRKKK